MRPLGLLLRLLFALGAGAVLAGCTLAAASHDAAPASDDDSGILTEYHLPADSGPWELRWDAARNTIWFIEGNHTSRTLDRLAALDLSTNTLREWGVPTAGAALHDLALDRNGDLWFTEFMGEKLGRLQPDSNTITEWTMPGIVYPHAVAVDDSDAANTRIWFSELDVDVITSFDPATGRFWRHPFPSPPPPFTHAWPHGIMIGAQHSLWVVDICDYRVGWMIPGAADQWTLWQPPTNIQCGPPKPGPQSGVLVGGDYWYSEPNNSNVLRLNPATNTVTIWPGPGAGTRQFTQIGLDPSGNVFFTEMRADKIGRLEPAGQTTPTIATVVPETTSIPLPPPAQSTPAVAVYTPIVSQLTPAERVLNGTRTGGFVEWPLLAGTPAPDEIGPARGLYADGGFWVSEVYPDIVARFAPFTPTAPPPSPTPEPTRTPVPTRTPRPQASPTPPGDPSPSTTPATPTGTPCAPAFSDVQPGDYFYTPVRALACRGVLGGYGDGSFRPYNSTTRAQMVKIVVLGFSVPVQTPAPGSYTFADVPPSFPFFAVIETAAAHNLVGGYGCGGPGEPCDPQSRPYFRPNADVTRGQLAKIVVAAAGWPAVLPGSPTFADVTAALPFYPFVETAVCHGIISGYGCGGSGEPCDPLGRPYFRPAGNSTRGQIAKIVYGALTGAGACSIPAVPR